jgi:hypothetical protein
MHKSENQNEMAGFVLIPDQAWNIRSFLHLDKVRTIRSSFLPALDKAWNIKPSSSLPALDKGWTFSVLFPALQIIQIMHRLSDLPFLSSRTRNRTSHLPLSSQRATVESQRIYRPHPDDCHLKLKQRHPRPPLYSIPLRDWPTYVLQAGTDSSVPEANQPPDVVILVQLISKTHFIYAYRYPKTGKMSTTPRFPMNSDRCPKVGQISTSDRCYNDHGYLDVGKRKETAIHTTTLNGQSVRKKITGGSSFYSISVTSAPDYKNFFLDLPAKC